MRKKTLSILLALIMVLSVIPVMSVSAAEVIIETGKCGDNISYSLSKNQHLRIYGTGKMYDYENEGSPFYNKDNINHITIEDGVTSIGAYAFYKCSVRTIDFAESVETLGEYSFAECSNLLMPIFPSKIKNIPAYCFYSSRLATNSIIIPANIEKIEKFAFFPSTSISRIEVYLLNPDCTYSIDESSSLLGDYSFSIEAHFNRPSDFKEGEKYIVTLAGRLPTCQNEGKKDCYVDVATGKLYADNKCTVPVTEKDLILPKTDHTFDEWIIDQEPSAEGPGLKHAVCKYCNEERTEEIPYHVVSKSGECGENADYTIYNNGLLVISGTGRMYDYKEPPSDFKDITRIEIKEGITYIGDYAFKNCSALTSIKLPASVTSIGEFAFYGCGKLETVTISTDSQLTSIGESAFENCSALTYVRLPASVTTIGVYAFYGCSNLKNTVILNHECIIEGFQNTISSGSNIYGFEGSTAQTYADNYSRTFIAIKDGIHCPEFIESYPATCTEDGLKEHYLCIVTGKLFSDEACTNELTETDVVIKATGHNLGEWASNNDGTHTRKCTNDGCEYSETKDCMFGVWEITKAATCTGKGEKKRTCSVCGYTETEEIEASGHKIEKIKAVEPTCTGIGNKEYYHCPLCGKYFKDAEGNTETTVAAETLDALGHKMEKIKAVKPTCTEGGNNEYYYCPVCEKYFKDAEGNTETTVAAETLDALGHKMEKTDAVKPTCTTDGNNEYYHCTVCDKYFKDAEGKTETTAEAERLAAPGHKWDEGKVTTAPTCTEDGIKTYTCPVCGETRTEVIKATGHVDADGDGKCDNCGESLSGGNTWFDKIEALFNLIIAILKAVAEFLYALGI